MQPGAHGPEHIEMVFLYALQALGAHDAPLAEARVLTCAECSEHLEILRPAIDAVGAGPTDGSNQSPALWQDVAPGISSKLLATDAERDRVTLMVRLAPGTNYPPHRHTDVEEVYLIHGTLGVNDEMLHAGDYRRAEPGSVDERVWSDTGCACVLVTAVRDIPF